jgi:methenyltetrahydromethanopterin cyclohydrolase
MLSINKLAYKLTKKLIESPDYYRVKVEKLPSGATVIDTGIMAHGGYEARARAEKAPSTNCNDYGKTSYEIYKAVNFDFTQIDPALFAPAEITLTCAKTGATFSYGEINYDLIKHSALD